MEAPLPMRSSCWLAKSILYRHVAGSTAALLPMCSSCLPVCRSGAGYRLRWEQHSAAASVQRRLQAERKQNQVARG